MDGNKLGSIGEVGSEPRKQRTSNTNGSKFQQQRTMWNTVKGLGQVEKGHGNTVAIFKVTVPLVEGSSEGIGSRRLG